MIEWLNEKPKEVAEHPIVPRRASLISSLKFLIDSHPSMRPGIYTKPKGQPKFSRFHSFRTFSVSKSFRRNQLKIHMESLEYPGKIRNPRGIFPKEKVAHIFQKTNRFSRNSVSLKIRLLISMQPP